MEWIATVLIALVVLAGFAPVLSVANVTLTTSLLAVLSDREQETLRRYEVIEDKLDRIAEELGIDSE